MVNFVKVVGESGVTHFIVHARKCLLKGLSPAQNRSIPPLRYDIVDRLIADFPEYSFSLNGGIQTMDEAVQLLETKKLAGVMMGRAAYKSPWEFRNADTRVFNCDRDPNLSRREVVLQYLDYAESMQETWGKVRRKGLYSMPNSILVRPLLNLFK